MSTAILLPAAQLEGTEATLSQWLVAVGETVSQGQPIAELETDKVAIEIVAPDNGVISELVAAVGDKIEADGLIAYLQLGTGVEPPSTTEAPKLEVSRNDSNEIQTPKSSVEQDGSCRHLLGPVVRKLIAEHELDKNRIVGRGRGGRITREDVLLYMSSGQAEQDRSQQQSHAASVTANCPQSSRRVPHTTMRKAIADHMVQSLLKEAPHVTSIFEMDMSNIIEHRKWHKKEFAEQGVKLTFTAYFLKASAKAMAAVPEMNAQFHQDALEIFSSVNIGVGTALGDSGLVVPVVNRVEQSSLFEVAQVLDAQTQRARNGKLNPSDMKGGTFTISNHGVSGSLMATPIIINQPQVAILGVGKMEKRVEVVEANGEDQMRIRPKCYVSLSIDHRAVDAHQTNAWLSTFVAEIENWGE